MKILAIADSDAFTESLRSLLDDPAIRVDRVADLEGAIDHARRAGLPALIAIDLAMPRGNELCGARFETPEIDYVPTIAIEGAERGGAPIHPQSAIVVSRPLDAEKLFTAINNALCMYDAPYFIRKERK